jgi:hypothetical protein
MVYPISCSTNRDKCHGSNTEGKKEEGSTMKKLGFATVAASAMAAAVIGIAAPAQAAPSGPGSAEQTISELQRQGYTVIVNRLGNAPLDQASVVAVRSGHTYSRTDHSGPGDDLSTKLLDKTVYVDVK